MAKQALILFAHGARDPRWAEPFLRLRDLVAAQRPDAAVSLAFLELMQPSLPDAVAAVAAAGAGSVTVVPVFLGQGGHVRRDLPALVETLRGAYPQVVFSTAEAVGENASVLAAMAAYCASH
ncbi:MAG TPA: CbiX/SirB N-terminal domain-containing protein [Burkholderiaceae bacterium]